MHADNIEIEDDFSPTSPQLHTETSTAVLSSDSDLSPNDAFRNRVVAGIYDEVVDAVLAMDPPHTALAQATYMGDFTRTHAFGSSYIFKHLHTDAEFEVVLVGQILPEIQGTKFSAKGTHYVGNSTNPNYIDDKTRVKCAFALSCGSSANKRMQALFHNQVVTLTDIVDTDRAEAANHKEVHYKEWTLNRAHYDVAHDTILVHTEPLYVIGKPSEKKIDTRSKKMKVDLRSAKGKQPDRPEGPVQHSTTHDTDNSQYTTNSNDTYHPSVLVDYGGDLFRHEQSVLRKLDLRDKENNHVHPSEWYSTFRTGTFVSVRATLHTYIWDTRRVYQVVGHTIRVIDHSPLQQKPRYSARLQVNAAAGSSASGGAHSHASDAINNLSIGKRRRDV